MTTPTDPTVVIAPRELLARHRTITGLRALADFLEANPAVPVAPFGEQYTFVVRTDNDAHGLAMIDHIAALLDVQATDNTGTGGHYLATRSFGCITYQAVYIPHRAWELHEAQQSYAPNICLDPPTGHSTDDTTSGSPDESASKGRVA